MCGRYTLTFEKLQEIEEFLNAVDRGEYSGQIQEPYAQYNISPSYYKHPDEVPKLVVYVNEQGNRVIDTMFWGFMKYPERPGKKPFTLINARDDSLMEKDFWTDSFLYKRCLIPADGFFEWTGPKGKRMPHYIYPTEEKHVAFAGLYSTNAPKKSGVSKSFAIITTEPNAVVEPLHDRMPAILHPSEFDDWLNPDITDPNYLLDLLHPYPDDAINEHIVGKFGGKNTSDPGLIEKADLFG